MRTIIWALFALLMTTGSVAKADEVIAATNTSGIVSPYVLVTSNNTFYAWNIGAQTLGASVMTNVIDVDATGLTGELCAVTTGNAITCRTRGAVATPTAVAKVEVGLGSQLAYIGTNGDVYMEIGGTFTNITVLGLDYTMLAANDNYLCATSTNYLACWDSVGATVQSGALNSGTFTALAVDSSFVHAMDSNGAYMSLALAGSHALMDSSASANTIASDGEYLEQAYGTWTHLSVWSDANGTYVLMGKAGQMQWAAYP